MLNRLSRILGKLEISICLFFLLFIVLGAVSRLVLRNFFEGDLVLQASEWLSTILPHSVLLLGLAATSLAFSKGRYIRLDLLILRLSEKFQLWILRFSALGSAIFFAGCSFLTLAFLVEDPENNILRFGYLPLFGLVSLRAILLLFTAATYIGNGQDSQ